jgi:UDP-N-acetylmuramyl pentapeptide phosphotransferase/UDP-N-acetylglucosamine-1-phosphate transferase
MNYLQYFIYIFLFLNLLLFINYFLSKHGFLVHISKKKTHKKIGIDQTPLSGGAFFMFFIFLTYFLYKEIISDFFLAILILFFILGTFQDMNREIKPLLRLLIQFILIFFLVFFDDIRIVKTDIFFLDPFLQSQQFNYIFVVSCILVYLNGLNFTDGVNCNTVGYLVLVIFSLLFINFQIKFFPNNQNLILLLIFLIIFYIFNFFNKNYLGDSGIYILSIFVSILIIKTVNNSYFVSPLISVCLLWYPAFETLFSILRKIFLKKNPFLADSLHLHTRLYKILISKKIKISNSLSGFFINLFLLPNFIICTLYYNNTKILAGTVVAYMALYCFFYLLCKNYEKN